MKNELPETCPICGFSLSRVARMETDAGVSVSCHCYVCGWLVFTPGAVDAVARVSSSRRRELLLRTLARTDCQAPLLIEPPRRAAPPTSADARPSSRGERVPLARSEDSGGGGRP